MQEAGKSSVTVDGCADDDDDDAAAASSCAV